MRGKKKTHTHTHTCTHTHTHTHTHIVDPFHNVSQVYNGSGAGHAMAHVMGHVMPCDGSCDDHMTHQHAGKGGQQLVKEGQQCSSMSPKQ